MRWLRIRSIPACAGNSLGGALDLLRGNRSIPACAGNSVARSLRKVRSSVHPRVCGEQAGLALFLAALIGPSPRVRGTGGWLHLTDNTDSVHPRVCGEQGSKNGLECALFGPSPRVRGTGPPALVANVFIRSIPACAGNSSACAAADRCGPVHPRVCGEQAPGGQARIDALRSIPACAGNRRKPRADGPRRLGPSPRVRGTG